jgi:hypothetical protein
MDPGACHPGIATVLFDAPLLGLPPTLRALVAATHSSDGELLRRTEARFYRDDWKDSALGQGRTSVVRHSSLTN